ncbi:NBS-LRR disease resistance protein-like [Panicum miliaceum]|uniref:NBS-LRR disease resistance protein-like n=1 Tax=Panicum miliaceum TaxID=4540 RepID=A0A3L6SVI8_PANMI|nr:NBS-LRR disease resistance protein-like [Panicum miliaceum]
MEAALVSGILKIVADKLVPPVLKELSSIAGVKKDLQELQGLVEETKSCLLAAGCNRMRSGSSSSWLEQLKDIAYDVEDLVHEFYLEAERHDADVDAHKIKKIKRRFAVVVKQRNDFNTIANSLPSDPAQHINKTTSELSLLLNVDETKDNRVKEHFEVTFWVHASREFNMEKLIGKLFELVANEKSESIGQLKSLTRLRITACKNLRQLPDEIRHLTSLQELHIEKCDALGQFPEGLGGLCSLRYLKINKLRRLRCLPQSIQHLASLQRLELEHCNDLQQLPEGFGNLSSLRSFHIYCLPALACLPESMQRLTSLQQLILSQCSALTVLPEWLGKLSALQLLRIQSCPSLMSLPHSIQHLTALKDLSITSCPELSKRYSEGVGEDWHLISHIPAVYVSRTMT